MGEGAKTKIILLVILVVFILLIMYFAKNGFNLNKEKIIEKELEEININLQIKNVQIEDDELSVRVKRTSGNGELIGLKFILDDGDRTEVIEEWISLDKYEQKSFVLETSKINISNIKSISVSPIYFNLENEEEVGEIKDEWESGEGLGEIPECILNSDCEEGHVCGNMTCVLEHCVLNNSCINSTCVGLECQDSCGNVFIGVLQPNCSLGYCGNASNGCGECYCANGFNCENNTCVEINYTNCTDTCLSLNYECGNQSVCGANENCGNCSNEYVCSGGSCVEESNCTDTCTSLNYECGVWPICGQNIFCGDCGSNENCEGGVCVEGNNCTSHSYSECYNGNVYWYNSCDELDGIKDTCFEEEICEDGECIEDDPEEIGYLLVDHNAVWAFEDIPDYWLNEAKKLTMHYAHTSHGSQITSGTSYVESYIDSKYSIAVRKESSEGLPSSETPMALRIYDGNPPETYIAPNDYWDGSSGISRTEAVANTGKYNFSMWSWCGQQSSNTESTVNEYLSTMKNFETDYPNMRFILMTGHTDGSGLNDPGETLTRNNKMVRDYALANNMIVFDFADIESWDPDGNFYSNADDDCDWCSSWCSSHPSDCQSLPSCAHSHGFNCVQKGKAFWWMMARLAGWDGTN